MSLPLRKCGLKFGWEWYKDINTFVTSLAEVWIEISNGGRCGQCGEVTSLAEVWIEIERHTRRIHNKALSLPLRKCGLKFSKYALELI